MWTCNVINFLQQNQLYALISQNFYFSNETLHVSDSSSVHHQEFHPDPARKLSANLYDIYHCHVYSGKLLMMGQRNCPKHVEFHSKNKNFEKLVRIVGSIIRNSPTCFGRFCDHHQGVVQ